MSVSRDGPFAFTGYDVTMAVRARCILHEETHLVAECSDLVYKPTQKLLQGVSDKEISLLCIRGRSYSYHEFNGLLSDVYVVAPVNKIAFLCTVVTRDQAHSAFAWNVKFFRRILDDIHDHDYAGKILARLEILERRGAMAILTERNGMKVPVDSRHLDKNSVVQGVKQLLKEIAPHLTQLPIDWMPHALKKNILAFVRETGNQIA